MDPQTAFCPNPDCPARGRCGEGNIGVHSRQERRYRCRVCGKTFAARQGTTFYRLRTTEETVTLVLTLLAHGCPLQAVVVAFGFDERTVQAWHKRAGTHCQQVQAHLVEQPRDLGQVQADELWVKLQGVKVWMALAIQVSSRLWLGGVVSSHRDRALIEKLVQTIRACALPRPLLFCVDGLAAYANAIRCRAKVRPGADGCSPGAASTSRKWSSTRSVPSGMWSRSNSASSRAARQPCNG